MLAPPIPANEDARLAALRRYNVLDSESEQSFDDLLLVATAICGTPMAAVSLIDADRQWFKARVGIGVPQTPRDESFCAHALERPDQVLHVPDASADPRFADYPAVTGADHVRFYAGAPLLSSDGYALGALCVVGRQPAVLTPVQEGALRALSRQASRLLEMRRITAELERQFSERQWYEQQLARYHAELEAGHADLVEQTRTDPLTGLHNRRALAAALDKALEAPPVSVALLDLDHFKAINDMQGHAEGDRVLVAVAGLLRGHVAGQGLVTRHGGEEFVLLLPGTAADQARLQCELLREQVALLPFGFPVSVSIGLAQARPGEGGAQVLERADQALYRAKREGRDRVCMA